MMMKVGGRSSNAATKKGDDTNDELDNHFAGMISCHYVRMNDACIIYSGTSDHMIASLENLHNVKNLSYKPKINLPSGSRTAHVTHMGDVLLKKGIKLKDVLYIPEFKQKLLSVQKLNEHDNSYVLFYKKYCVMQDSKLR